MSQPAQPAADSPVQPVPHGRRSFLRGVLGVGAAGAAAGVAGGIPAGYAAGTSRATRPAAASPAVAAADPEGRLAAVPFHGRHQAGILPPPQRQAVVVAFDVTAASRGELTDLLRTMTERARFLTAGGTPPPTGITGPPSDSGVLGPAVVPDGLAVTVGVGASLFDDRYGLAGRKPANLTTMLPFPNDDLDPAQCHGDLSLQLAPAAPTRCCTRCATSPATPAAPCRCAGASTVSPARRGPPAPPAT